MPGRPDPFKLLNDLRTLHNLVKDITALKEKILILEQNRSNDNGITECINKFKEVHVKMFALENVWNLEDAAKVAKLFQTTLDNFNLLISDLENPEKQIQKELDDIVKGLYQDELESFTVNMREGQGHRFLKEATNLRKYTVYPIMDKEGFHCTASIPTKVTTYPIEIQINFMGTIDFASKMADLEISGPGQETLKKYEAELVQKVNNLIAQVSRKYPDAPIKLRIAGQSLGGAFAKGFTHTLQRACAIQFDTPQHIVNKIETNVGKFGTTAALFTENKNNLLKKLEADVQQFQSLTALKKISGITLYALASPGVSIQTDKDATLLTYYQAPNFLQVYNHFHREDIIPKFGESEFLSGNYGKPQILVHKAIIFDCELRSKHVVTLDSILCLPFPGVTKRVIEAHLVNLYAQRDIDKVVTNNIIETVECNEIKEKFIFSCLLHALYDIGAFVAKNLARSQWLIDRIPFLSSYTDQELTSPTITVPTVQRFEHLKFGDQKQRFFKIPANVIASDNLGASRNQSTLELEC